MPNSSFNEAIVALSHYLSENIAHISVDLVTLLCHIGLWQTVSIFRCCFTAVFVGSRHLNQLLNGRLIASWLQRPPVAAHSPVTTGSFSKSPVTCRPFYLSSVKWEWGGKREWNGGGIKGRRDRLRVVLHWGTAAFLKLSPPTSQPQWKSEVRMR